VNEVKKVLQGSFVCVKRRPYAPAPGGLNPAAGSQHVPAYARLVWWDEQKRIFILAGAIGQ
jgi:hypothetical protein